MSTKPNTPSTDSFENISADALESVAGGAARASKSGDAELTAMLSSIGDSIKDLAANKNNNQGGDTMQLMLMMLMMGGMGGGGGGAVAAAPACAPQPQVINVETAVAGGCRRIGKKGW